MAYCFDVQCVSSLPIMVFSLYSLKNLSRQSGSKDESVVRLSFGSTGSDNARIFNSPAGQSSIILYKEEFVIQVLYFLNRVIQFIQILIYASVCDVNSNQMPTYFFHYFFTGQALM